LACNDSFPPSLRPSLPAPPFFVRERVSSWFSWFPRRQGGPHIFARMKISFALSRTHWVSGLALPRRCKIHRRVTLELEHHICPCLWVHWVWPSQGAVALYGSQHSPLAVAERRNPALGISSSYGPTVYVIIFNIRSPRLPRGEPWAQNETPSTRVRSGGTPLAARSYSAA